MVSQNRRICLLMDHAPCHLILNQPIPDFSNIQIVYVGRNMTDKPGFGKISPIPIPILIQFYIIGIGLFGS